MAPEGEFDGATHKREDVTNYAEMLAEAQAPAKESDTVEKTETKVTEVEPGNLEQTLAFKNELTIATTNLSEEAVELAGLDTQEQNFITTNEVVRNRFLTGLQNLNNGTALDRYYNGVPPVNNVRLGFESASDDMRKKAIAAGIESEEEAAGVDASKDIPKWKAENTVEAAMLPLVRLRTESEAFGDKLKFTTRSAVDALSAFTADMRILANRTDNPDLMEFVDMANRLVADLANDAQSSLAAGSRRSERMTELNHKIIPKGNAALAHLRSAV